VVCFDLVNGELTVLERHSPFQKPVGEKGKSSGDAPVGSRDARRELERPITFHESKNVSTIR
jgi:hypothetical protein